MPVRKGTAVWNGGLKEGRGSMSLSSGAFEGAYSFGSRFEEEKGTNPEELIGAALAGCFSMFLSGLIESAGYDPQSVKSQSKVRIEKDGQGFRITGIELNTEATIPNIDEKFFMEQAEAAKQNCPVGQALRVPISLSAKLNR